MTIRLSEIVSFIEEFAPPKIAEEWDKGIGLTVGDFDAEVSKVLVALDVDFEILAEAESTRCELILTHHPLLFRAVRSVNSGTFEGRLIMELARKGIAHFAMHTNLDGADSGLCAKFAEFLGLTCARPMAKSSEDALRKLAVFVPKDHAENVRAAMCAAGAGVIGEYTDCSFRTEGTGTFRGSDASNPFLGKKGELESAEEFRLEVLVSESRVADVLKAMKTSHPYEEVAYDLFPLLNPGKAYGVGLVGELPEPVRAREIAEKVKAAFGLTALPYAGDLEREVRMVGLCTGSGGDLVEGAIQAGCDVYITGDVKYHQFDAARRAGMIVIDCGHYESEIYFLREVARTLGEICPLDIEIIASTLDRNPRRML
ncbi:MAG: Nif3-like dinuclear metal center hexameric protein [Planctomycetes bacterium]|nr:Nif3-like dinuclear metal center hexameric protein [Planctomycetota bacterium]